MPSSAILLGCVLARLERDDGFCQVTQLSTTMSGMKQELHSVFATSRICLLNVESRYPTKLFGNGV